MSSLRLIAVAVAVAAALLATACPRSTRRTPVGPSIPTHGDAQARSRFEEERSRFERDDTANNTEAFTQIARDFPEDPIAPHALLYAGRAAFRVEDYDAAVTALREADALAGGDDALRARVRLYLGMSYGYLGRHAEALELLRSSDGVLDDHERAERLAVIAESAAATGDRGWAFRAYDEWFAVARPSERAYVIARVRELAEQMDLAEAGVIYDGLPARNGPSAVFLGERLAAAAAASGDVDRAAALRTEIARARSAIGLPSRAGSGDGGDPRLVGAVLPLSGRRGKVGEAALGGLALAAGAFSPAGAPFAVSLRDSTSQAPGAATAVDALAAEGAIAVVGPLDAAGARTAGERAAALGVPLLTLAPVPAGAAEPFVFHVALSPESRARALARAGVAAGAKRFAVLGPESNYGRETAAAFRAEVEARGGVVVAEAWYDRAASSFTKPVDVIRGKPFDAVFIPDTASRLELIVPALAAANLQVQPPGAKAPKVGRGVMLLSTAEGLSPRYLRSSARYSHGAVFAPGFYPDEADPVIGPFAAEYTRAHGRAPTYLDAYAYDAALLVRAALAAGARTRAEVDAAVAGGSVVGLTGTISFDAGRRRGDAGVLYVVERDVGGEFLIRAHR